MESLWVRIKGQASVGYTTVGVYYRLPDQEKESDKAFKRQLAVVLWSQALVLMGDFNHLDIYCQSNTTRQFMMRVVVEPTRKEGYFLNLFLTKKEHIGMWRLRAATVDALTMR